MRAKYQLAGCMVLTILSVAFAGQARAADPAPCQLVSYASLPMRTLPGGLITVPMKIRDRELYFLPDTGGVISTLNEDIADSLQLKRGSARPIGGVGEGVVMNQTVSIDNFSIGLMAGHGFNFYVSHLRTPDMAGTLAPNLLRNFDLDFDFAGGWLNLISKNPCPGAEVYWTKGPFAVIPMTIDPDSGHIQISVKVDGKEVNAIVDTGATTSVMSVGSARWNMMLDESQMKKQQAVINGAVRQTFAYPFKTIDFEGVAVTNPHILVLADRDLPVTQAILGSDVLRQLHLYISYKERKIYVTSATAH